MLLATLATMVGDLFAERLEAVFAQWAGLSLRDAHRAQAPASFQPLRAAMPVIPGLDIRRKRMAARRGRRQANRPATRDIPADASTTKTVPLVARMAGSK
ncbi:MAG: hypothetical protein IKO40_10685 [Kiritimatiellae bacterium]|nr:hypothetical protein [Kiritimatiellia bacterium]